MGLVINNRWFLLDYAEKKNLPAIYDLLDGLQEKKGNVACTDGKVIYIDPDLFNQEEVESQFFILCHELLHIIYKHVEMSKDPRYKSHELLNIAQDIVINEYLQKRLRYKEPSGLYLDNLDKHLHNMGLLGPMQHLRYEGQLTTRDLYDFIARKMRDQDDVETLSNLCNTRDDLIEDAETLPSEAISSEVLQQVCERLKIDKRHLSRELDKPEAQVNMPYEPQAGSGDGFGIDSGISKKNIVSTQDIIKFVKEFIGNNAVVKGRQQTYTRPSRRFQSNDYVMKGYKHYKDVKEIDIYLDTSGSMNSQFIADMYSALKTLYQTTKFKLYEFKGSVREVNLKGDYISATGGTNISNVLKHIEENKFDHAILITDCEDRFSLADVKSDLMIFTNNLNFKSNNPRVRLTYFR